MKKPFILQGIIDALYLFVAVLIAAFTGGIPVTIVRFFIQNNNLAEDITMTIVGLAIEIAIVFTLFYKKCYNDRGISLPELLLPLAVAMPLHFLIALWNTFFPYTAGPFVTYGGTLIGTLMGIEGEHAMVTPLEVPIYIFVPLYLLKAAFVITTIYLSYLYARKRLDKERNELLREKEERGY